MSAQIYSRRTPLATTKVFTTRVSSQNGPVAANQINDLHTQDQPKLPVSPVESAKIG
jgi:hypothetical protein